MDNDVRSGILFLDCLALSGCLPSRPPVFSCLKHKDERTVEKKEEEKRNEKRRKGKQRSRASRVYYVTVVVLLLLHALAIFNFQS
jgi:hypothetical protein